MAVARENKGILRGIAMNDLKRLIDWAFYSLIPLTLLSLAAGLLSDSLTILTVAIDSGLSLIVSYFAFYSIRVVLQQNVFSFPYGTGKLENFSSFLYGSLMIPTSLFILYFSISRFFSPPTDINFGMTQVSTIPQFLRSLILLVAASRLIRKEKTPSPMLESYHTNFHVALVSDLTILVAFFFAFLLVQWDMARIANYIDPVFSLIIGVYMLYHGCRLLVANFKSLINLPLPESDQLKIMSVLARNFDKYDNIGNLYTMSSGRTRFVELELVLPSNTDIREVAALRLAIEKDLQELFEDIRFTLIPLPSAEPVPVVAPNQPSVP